MGRVRASVAAAAGVLAGVCAAQGWSDLPRVSTLIGLCAAIFGALAGLNLARSSVPPGALIGPGVLASLAGLVFAADQFEEHRWHLHPAWWLIAGVGGALLALGAILGMPSAPGRALAIGWTRRVKCRPTDGGRYVAVIALGACQLDFTPLARAAGPEPATPITLRCVLAGGHVTLLVPTQWRIAVDPASAVIAVSVDDGSRSTETEGPTTLTIALLAFAGGLRVRRR